MTAPHTGQMEESPGSQMSRFEAESEWLLPVLFLSGQASKPPREVLVKMFARSFRVAGKGLCVIWMETRKQTFSFYRRGLKR